LYAATEQVAASARDQLALKKKLLRAFDPDVALQRGYALVRLDGRLVHSGKQVKAGDDIGISLSDARMTANVKQVTME